MSVSAPPARPRVLFRPFWVAGAVLLCGLLCAPWYFMAYDVLGGFLPWARVSGGRAPWDIYAHTPTNYPPFALYLLTLLERGRLWAGGSVNGWFSVLLLKLPNVLAWAAGVPLCWFGLRRALGERPARAAAVAYALCLPLFFNAAIWGQYDALLSLAVAAVMVALVGGQTGWAGAAFGWALSIKLQAVLVFPAVAVYLWRRWGARGLGRAAVAAAVVWLTVALPFLWHGQARPLLAAYTGAAGYYPALTVSACNGWFLLQWYHLHVMHLPPDLATSDARQLFLPLLSYKTIGLIVLVAYNAWLLLVLWRRPSPLVLFWSVTLGAYGFFMLPTEMHERYLVPASALACLAAGLGPRSLDLAISLCLLGLLNQYLWFDNVPHTDTAALVLSAVNLVLFLKATYTFRRMAAENGSAVAAPAAWPRDEPAQAVDLN